jgi:hypothetical protein
LIQFATYLLLITTELAGTGANTTRPDVHFPDSMTEQRNAQNDRGNIVATGGKRAIPAARPGDPGPGRLGNRELVSGARMRAPTRKEA